MNAPPQQWTEPGVFEAAPGVFRIPLPLPNDALRAVNVYAIADGPRVVLIDSGWALESSQEQLARSLDSIGYGLSDISRFLITHLHRDHYTQAVAVRRTFGTTVELGTGERPAVDWLVADPSTRSAPPFEQLYRCGAPELARTLAELGVHSSAEHDVWERPDRWLDDGVDLPLSTRTLRAIATPGHTQGHVVFLDAAAGVMFAGDHVLPHITPSIGFEPAPRPSPLSDYLTSLQLVRALPDVRLLPAHGPTTDSVHERVDELLDHHAARLDQTLVAVAAGADTAAAAAGQLTWTRRLHRLPDLDPFNQMLAIMETAAHLEVLVERGHLRAADVDGVRHYACA